jgi:alanine racemase
VAYLEEALELREAGIHAPLLVLGTTDPGNADIIIANAISQTVFTPDLAKALSEAAHRLGKAALAHIKIDTGMHRQGIEPGQAGSFALFLSRLGGIKIEGCYSHFTEADNPRSDFSARQIERFKGALEDIKAEGIDPGIKHMANSAALLRIPESRMDMVRPGVLLYGMSPEADHRLPKGFKPVMEFRAAVTSLRDIGEGEGVSYGRIFIAPRPTRIALLQVGYADGYSRHLSNRAAVMIRGQRAPVAGRVCMDQIMVDVTDIPEVKVGDEATLFGLPGLPAGELAEIMGTIDYEVSCGISKRVPRVLIERG